MGPKLSGGGGSTGETSDGTQPKSKKHKKNKKPKTNQSDGDGTAATVTKDKAPTVTSKDPPKLPISSYCFQCGEDDHTMKGCKETGNLKCDNHAGAKNHMTCACIIYHKANNLNVHPLLLRFEGSANRVNAENEDEIFRFHPDNSLEVISESDQSINHPNKAQQGGFSACTVTLVSGVPSSDNYRHSQILTGTHR